MLEFMAVFWVISLLWNGRLFSFSMGRLGERNSKPQRRKYAKNDFESFYILVYAHFGDYRNIFPHKKSSRIENSERSI